MQKIVDYTILDDSKKDLPRKVIELIGQGWEPLGGVNSTVNGQQIVTCYQAMVLYSMK